MEANNNRGYEATHLHNIIKYFWPNELERPGITQCGPQQLEIAFQRRFKMP